MIDKMFQQEIMNAKLRQKHWIRFKINNFIKFCCPSKTTCFLPRNYINPENSGGNILQKILGFDTHKNIDDFDDDISVKPIKKNKKSSYVDDIEV